MDVPWSVCSYRKPHKIAGGSMYTLKGWSLVVVRTNFYIPELNVMFDVNGLSGELSADMIFITHQHCDYTCNIPHQLMVATKKGRKIKIFAPAKSCDEIVAYIDSAYLTTLDFTYSSKQQFQNNLFEMIPLSSSTRFSVLLKKKKFDIEVFKWQYISSSCFGYGLIEKRNKLKEEYLELSGKELCELKKQKVEIIYELEIPLLLYLGDTSSEVLEVAGIEKYTTIVLECSFVSDGDMDQAMNTQEHMHWRLLHPYVLRHPKTTFVIYHSSRRYSDDVLEYLHKLCIDNLVPWIFRW
jgi:ribonuclease Z